MRGFLTPTKKRKKPRAHVSETESEHSSVFASLLPTIISSSEGEEAASQTQPFACDETVRKEGRSFLDDEAKQDSTTEEEEEENVVEPSPLEESSSDEEDSTGVKRESEDNLLSLGRRKRRHQVVSSPDEEFRSVKGKVMEPNTRVDECISLYDPMAIDALCVALSARTIDQS